MLYLSLLQRIALTLVVTLWLFVPFSAGNSHAADIGDLDLIAQAVDSTDKGDSDDSDADSADADDESDSEDSESEDSDSGDSDAEEDSDSNEQSSSA